MPSMLRSIMRRIRRPWTAEQEAVSESVLLVLAKHLDAWPTLRVSPGSASSSACSLSALAWALGRSLVDFSGNSFPSRFSNCLESWKTLNRTQVRNTHVPGSQTLLAKPGAKPMPASSNTRTIGRMGAKPSNQCRVPRSQVDAVL